MSKPKCVVVTNGTPVINEFDTEQEAQAFREQSSPTDPVKLARRLLISKEEVLCRELLDDLRDEFKKQVEEANMTIAQATTLFTLTRDTFLALRCGWLRESRVIANNTATSGPFTQGRKDFLLAQIDAAIARL